jgi:ADP-dependent NAD(P)H-hydrate dehydratase / NAD(P)H-hydrate epimerase
VDPVVTVAEMKAIDAGAREPEEVLIQRAGRAVASAAVDLLGGSYGRRIVVVAGKGNNGADGRVAADVLRGRGARVDVVDAGDAPARLPPRLDLVIDAAYGTGFTGAYRAPVTDAPVLAVDIPSGVDGDTGVAAPGAVSALATVTFAALKPGLLLGDGPDRAGLVRLADIGLDCSRAGARLVTDSDVGRAGLGRGRGSHKWSSAVGVVAGAPGMMGAPSFVSRGAQRAGAGMVRLGVPGARAEDLPAAEAVVTELPAGDWSAAALEWTSRCGALVVGPGLGRSESTAAALRSLLAASPLPAVVDADALHALGTDAASILRGRKASTVLTPHDGEFRVLSGAEPGADRMAAVRDLAARTGATVLLKGSTTLVADPDGPLLFCTSGSARLATAGTGDVLSGVIGAFLAMDVPALSAAALGAHVHGRAAQRGRAVGLVASDLPDLVSDVLSEIAARP